MALNLIGETKPLFTINQIKEGTIPNYEGRIMAFVILVLKLLFGLDGVTEFKFSDFATKTNNKLECGNKMFVFTDWIKFIEYRKTVLKSQHFPTCYLLDGNCSNNLNLFANFLEKQRLVMDNEKTSVSIQVKQKLLTDLDELQDHSLGSFLNFSPTLTPFYSYTQKILSFNVSINDNHLYNDILSDTTKNSVDFLLYPKKYLKELSGNEYVILENGANPNMNFMKIISKNEKIIDSLDDWNKAFEELKFEELSVDKLENKVLKTKISEINHKNNGKPILPLKHPEIKLDLVLSKSAEKRKNEIVRDNKGRFCKKDSTNINNNPTGKRKRGQWFISSWTTNPLLEQNDFNLIYKISKGKDLEKIIKSDMKHLNKKKESLKPTDGYNIHYEPHKEYWINVANLNHRHFDKFMWKELKNSLPFTFMWILNECARIIEQDPKDLFQEFVIVELYFIYVYLEKTTTVTNNGNDNSEEIIKLIKTVMREW